MAEALPPKQFVAQLRIWEKRMESYSYVRCSQNLFDARWTIEEAIRDGLFDGNTCERCGRGGKLTWPMPHVERLCGACV